MMDYEETRAAFMRDLKQLLRDYDAELYVVVYGDATAELKVWSYAQWEDGEEVRSHIDIDLGTFINGD